MNFNKTFLAKTSKIPEDVMTAPITLATINVTNNSDIERTPPRFNIGSTMDTPVSILKPLKA